MTPYVELIERLGGHTAISKAYKVSRQQSHTWAKVAYVNHAGFVYIPSVCETRFLNGRHIEWEWRYYDPAQDVPVVETKNWAKFALKWVERGAMIHPYSGRIYFRSTNNIRLTLPTN